MRRAALIGLFLVASVVACPRPAPVPVTPADATCDIDSALHDMIANDVVTTLQDGSSLTSAVTRYTKPVVKCVVEEIIEDAQSAPQLVGRAQYWMATDGAH